MTAEYTREAIKSVKDKTPQEVLKKGIRSVEKGVNEAIVYIKTKMDS